MQEPSLSEITNIRPEATTNPGVVLEGGKELVHQLNQSAQFNAEMRQRRYTEAMGRLGDIYKDIGKVSAMSIMQEDRPVIQKKLADIFTQIGNDPRAALALNGQKYGQLEKQLGEVTALATQSKQDNLYDDFHQKYIQSDPALDTPENRAKIASHNKQSLGSRSKYMLETPAKFDAEKAAGNIMKQKNVAIPYANSEFSADNKFINRETGTRYDRQNFLKTWNAGYEFGTDDNGKPIKQWATDQFKKIKDNPTLSEQYGNPKDPQELYNNIGATMFGSDQDIMGEKTSQQLANPYEMMNKRQSNAIYMEAIKEGNKEKLAAVRKSLEQQGAPENANFLVRQYADIVGNTTGKQKAIDTGGGKYETEQEIDVPNNILKNWANDKKETLKSGGSLDPTTETIIAGQMPDVKTRTKDGNIRLTFYKHYDKSDKIPKGSNIGDEVLSADGKRIYDHQVVIPRRSLLASIGGPVIEKKILSSAIEQADGYLKNKGAEDIDLINRDETTPSESHSKPVPSKGKSYKLGTKSFSESQIEKAAKASGMTTDEYIKKAGLK